MSTATSVTFQMEGRLDGCACNPVRGSHRRGCPWAASQRVNAAPRADRHAPGTTKSVRLAGDGRAVVDGIEEWAKAAGMTTNAALLLAWREFLETHRAAS